MKHLFSLNKYFWKYRRRLGLGILFVIVSNYFAVVGPEITGFLVSDIQQLISGVTAPQTPKGYHDFIVSGLISYIKSLGYTTGSMVAVFCMIILLVALIRGALMFLMRQTLIVMSRHIEFDLKNDVFEHYQKLDVNFFKSNKTGDLMSRITEDVSRVRMYAGPAIMYLTNLTALIIFCVINMWRKAPELTLFVLAPLPVLAITIYIVNMVIYKKSEHVQAALARLTTNAQESYSGIRVIKSFVQEKAMLKFFTANSHQYRKESVRLAKVEAMYFPSMALMIGLSTLIAVYFGAKLAIADPAKIGLVVEFVIYINMLTFPVSSIGWVASMVQRASASQKRINEFLHTQPAVNDNPDVTATEAINSIRFSNVNFVYPNTGIQAIRRFNLSIEKGEKILVLGKTGSGKSTIPQLLLRFYDSDSGELLINGKDIKTFSIESIRSRISFVPQDVFLFSTTVKENIAFGATPAPDVKMIESAAEHAAIRNEISSLTQGFDTVVGERGQTLSGGQKQRISLARALLKNSDMLVLDDSLSAVDASTENKVLQQLSTHYGSKTLLVISHRVFPNFSFDKIIYLVNGEIAEYGTHDELMQMNGSYHRLFNLQIKANKQ